MLWGTDRPSCALIGELKNEDAPMKYVSLLPLLALMILSACETVQGAGRDLETAGEAITEESQDVQAQN